MPTTRRSTLLAGGTAVLVALAASIGDRSATDASAAPRSTKLVHGPVLLRLVGDPDRKAEAQYTVLFRLNQDVRARRFTTVGNRSVRGNFSLNEYEFNDNGPDPFSRRGCFALTIYGPESPLYPTDNRRLDRLPVGRRLKVRMQPLTPGADGKPVLGRVLVSRPRLQEADYRLRGRTARNALKRLGCEKGSSPL